ncbi:hypothetical protein ACXR2T_09280 [Leucobacter sp. HY1910]
MNTKSLIPGYLIMWCGVALLLWGLAWAVIIGYYPSELPFVLGLLVVGSVGAFVGQKMVQAAKRSNVEQRIEQRKAEGE